MDKRIFKIFICCICISLAGCMANVAPPYHKAAYQVTPTKSQRKWQKRAKSFFAYSRRRLRVHETIYGRQDFKNYQVSFLRFHSVGDNGQDGNDVTAYYFRSKLPGPKKLLIMVPIWGGAKYPSRAISQGMLKASKGHVNVIRILGANNLINMEKLESAESPKVFRRLLRKLARRTKVTVIDARRLINWAVSQGDISRKSVTVIGFSRGAIGASFLAQIDPNITGAILVMSGAGPGRILYDCNYYDIRKEITKRFHWSNEKLLSVLQHYMGIFNVARYPTRLNPSHVLMFTARYDQCFLTKPKNDLWLSMGKPRRISLLFVHRLAFLTMTAAGGYFMRRKIYQFVIHDYTLPK